MAQKADRRATGVHRAKKEEGLIYLS